MDEHLLEKYSHIIVGAILLLSSIALGLTAMQAFPHVLMIVMLFRSREKLETSERILLCSAPYLLLVIKLESLTGGDLAPLLVMSLLAKIIVYEESEAIDHSTTFMGFALLASFALASIIRDPNLPVSLSLLVVLAILHREEKIGKLMDSYIAPLSISMGLVLSLLIVHESPFSSGLNILPPERILVTNLIGLFIGIAVFKLLENFANRVADNLDAPSNS